jgi:hypothetical protein
VQRRDRDGSRRRDGAGRLLQEDRRGTTAAVGAATGAGAEHPARRAGIDLSLYATDDDPYDALAPALPGGPAPTSIFRRRIAILGKSTTGPPRDTCWVAPGDFPDASFNLTIPDWIANGPITLLVRLCDCYGCDVLPGPGACPAFAGGELRPTFGTCVDTSIPCRLQAPGPAAMAGR